MIFTGTLGSIWSCRLENQYTKVIVDLPIPSADHGRMETGPVKIGIVGLLWKSSLFNSERRQTDDDVDNIHTLFYLPSTKEVFRGKIISIFFNTVLFL